MIKINKNFTAEYIYNALNTAFIKGFTAQSAVFPVAGQEGEEVIDFSDKDALNFENTPEQMLKFDPHSEFSSDFRTQKGAESLFVKGEFLQDKDCDFLPDQVNLKILLEENTDIFTLISACNLAFRLGMETTAFSRSIAAKKGEKGNLIRFEKSDTCSLSSVKAEEYTHFIIKGQGENLVKFTSALCENFPQISPFKNWCDILCGMTEDFALQGLNGQLAALLCAQKENPDNKYTLFAGGDISKKQKEYFKNAEFENYKEGKEVYSDSYDFAWEADVLEDILQTEVYPKIKKGDKLCIKAAVSEDEKVRKNIAEKISDQCSAKGAVLEELQLVCSYKQGYSWIKETVIPKIQNKNCDKVQICFKPFLPKGQTVWMDENGATPSYHNLKADDPDKWYDLPIRYLQELYPIEDELVKQLNIPKENIVFSVLETDEDITYLFKGYSKEKTVYTETYFARCSERAYLDEYTRMGKVHPSTNYIEAVLNGKEIINRTFKSDLENVWDIYQSKVLPKCRKYIEEKYKGSPAAENQPFFSCLELDIALSEPDEKLSSRQDLISSLDALHEDMYFAGADYFKNLGVHNFGQMFDSPGLILPKIIKREGKGSFKATLFDTKSDKAKIICQGSTVCGQTDRKNFNAYITKVTWENMLCVTAKAEGVSDDFLKAYAQIINDGISDIKEEFSKDCIINFESENGNIYPAYIKAVKYQKDIDINSIDICENSVIGYDEYINIINQLKRVQGLEVMCTARSYSGRKVYSVWIKPQYQGYLSMTKRLTAIPSVTINARHHANEVSSTNAAFMLIKKILTCDEYKNLPDKLNLVITPVENTDGCAIHYALQKDNPNWKLHVARFNALGREFFSDTFKTDTIHTEAMAFTQIYEKYIPDIMVDNHGVPSHEWEQQFSGYTSPSYKGFWLPRSLLYGYYWCIKQEEYRENLSVNKSIQNAIADKIAGCEQMAQLNSQWAYQFEKYAHAWMPKLFPAQYYKGMIDYFIDFDYNSEHKYPSIRFPWITSCCYTSEVADETAQGDYLNLCAKAHLAHDEATLQLIMNAKIKYNKFINADRTDISGCFKRVRPVNL